MALLAAYNYQITNLDRSLRQEDQTGHEIVDHALQAEADTNGERPSQDGQIGKIEACIGKRSQRRDHDADVAHADADRDPHPARNPGRLQDVRIEPALEHPRGRISHAEHDDRSEQDTKRYLRVSNMEAEELTVPVVDVGPPVTPLQQDEGYRKHEHRKLEDQAHR